MEATDEIPPASTNKKPVSGSHEYKRRLDMLFLRSSSRHYQTYVLVISLFCSLRIFGSLITFIFVTRRPELTCWEIGEKNRTDMASADLPPLLVTALAENITHAVANFSKHDWLRPILADDSLGHTRICANISIHDWIRLFGHTVITQFDGYITVLSLRVYEAFIFFFVALGGFLFILAAEYNGRHPMMVVACVIDLASCFMAAYSQYYAFWVIMKLVSYAAVGGQIVMLYTFLVEFLPRAHMTYYRALLVCFAALSYATVALMARYLYDWRKIEVVSIVPCMVNIILCVLFFYNSPLWAYSKCNDRIAKRIMRQICRINGEKRGTWLNKQIDQLFLGCGHDNSRWKVLEIFEDWHLFQRASCMTFVWFSFLLFYLHLTLETEHFVGGELFFSVGFMSLVDTCSPLVCFLADRFLHPRKASLLYVAATFISIVIAVTVQASTHDAPSVVIVYFLLARLFALCGALHFIRFVRRVFPIHMRGTGLMWAWVCVLCGCGLVVILCIPIVDSTAEVTFHCIVIVSGGVVTFLLPRILGRQFSTVFHSRNPLAFETGGGNSPASTLNPMSSRMQTLQTDAATTPKALPKFDDEEKPPVVPIARQEDLEIGEHQ